MSRVEQLTDSVSLYCGDDASRIFPDNSVDSVVTDPPYHLTSIVQRRISLLLAGPDERARTALKAAGKADYSPLPLFGVS